VKWFSDLDYLQLFIISFIIGFALSFIKDAVIDIINATKHECVIT
jgi:hypothetical protein